MSHVLILAAAEIFVLGAGMAWFDLIARENRGRYRA